MPDLNQEYTAALAPVVDVLERLGVSYYIGGSVASSQYGTARTTLDIDIVAALEHDHVSPLVESLSAAYYIAAVAASRAIDTSSCFNIIHTATAIKIDVFVARTEAHTRRQLHTFADADRLFYFASPEDTILAKLDWYERGDRSSERQWSDILGVLRVQSAALDFDLLRAEAVRRGLGGPLERALEEASG